MSDMKEAVRGHYGSLAGKTGCCGGETPDAGGCCESPATGAGSCCASSSSTPLGCGMPLGHAELRPGEMVLDLGCGPGIEVLAAARAVGPAGHVVGVDMTPEMVEAARSRIAGQAGNVEIVLADIEALPLEADSVDVVVSNCVINLAPDKSRVFGEMHRVLKGGGRFSISDVVTRGEMPEAARSDPRLWAGCVSGAIEEIDYLRLLREAGFAEVRVAGQADYGRLPGSECLLRSVTVTGRKPPGAGVD